MEIVTIPADVLYQKAQPIREVNASIVELADNMIDAMHAAQGIGLAAPQVDVPLRLFVIRVVDDEPRLFINPEIIGTSVETVRMEEGCLSIPGLYADVVRPRAVEVQAYNRRGRPFTLQAEGLLARVIQHELDHLNGVLFLDHLAERKRERMLRNYDAAQYAQS
ncbi:MAG: peptide deformylase [Spirochaetaceae bacterium]|nr:MAG: peptide deformylase [Spirochaetaceae bacterium]